MKKRILHINDILDSQRIDVAYFMSDLGDNSFVSLSKYVNIRGGKRIPKGETFSFEKTNNLYLRLSDITDFDNINYTDLKCISEELYDKLKRYEIRDNTIVFSIAGTIGRVFVVKNIPEGKRIILTENCAMLFPKNEHVLPDYVSILLNCSFVQKQIEQKRIMTTIPKIGLDRIAKLKVPEIPPIDVQLRIISIYQDAIRRRSSMTNEAKQLINSIDDYLLKALRIKKERNATKKIIQSNISFIVGDRIDVQFHIKNEVTLARIRGVPHKPLGDIATFSFETWDQKSIFKDEFPYIEINTVDIVTGEINNIENVSVNKAPSRAKKIVRKNDILISTTRPNRGAICIYEHDDLSIASTGFAIIRKTTENVLKEYLSIVLKSSISLEQMAIRSSGGNYPSIIESELKKVLVPTPSIIIQKEIINTVSKIKIQAKQLQEEGDSILKETKQKIEQLIFK